MPREPDSDNGQLSLLHGFVSSERSLGTQPAAPALPVARVLLDSPLPHLDRPFDYLVPADLDTDAVPGARVKVRFGEQELAGFITERTAQAGTSARLVPLGKVVSPQPVLHDVLRVAIPPRAAQVDKEFTAQARGADNPDPDVPAGPEGSGPNPWARYQHGPRFLTHLAAGHSPRAVLASLGGFGPGAWPEEIAAAVHSTLLSGRGAVVVVPDAKDLTRLGEALTGRIGADALSGSPPTTGQPPGTAPS